MNNTEKNLVADILIGAAVATAAIILFIPKAKFKPEVHLFNTDDQEGKEELIDKLVPSCDKKCTEEPKLE